jgi:hypothetical protein
VILLLTRAIQELLQRARQCGWQRASQSPVKEVIMTHISTTTTAATVVSQ